MTCGAIGWATPRWLFLGSVLLTVACRTPTSIELDLKTNLACADIGGTTVTVGKPGAVENAPETTSTLACRSDGTIGGLVVVPATAKDEALAIKIVSGIKQSPELCVAPSYGPGCIVARREISFLPHEGLHLPIGLFLDCTGVACGETTTCNHGTCVDDRIGDPNDCKTALGCDLTDGTDGAGGAGGAPGCASCVARDACHTATCSGTTCVQTTLPDDVILGGQTPGDCQAITCESGKVVAVADPDDLPSSQGNACVQAACTAGKPSVQNLDGATCNGGQGTCLGGVCSSCSGSETTCSGAVLETCVSGKYAPTSCPKTCANGACVDCQVASDCGAGNACTTVTCGPNFQCATAPLDGTPCSLSSGSDGVCQKGMCEANAGGSGGAGGFGGAPMGGSGGSGGAAPVGCAAGTFECESDELFRCDTTTGKYADLKPCPPGTCTPTGCQALDVGGVSICKTIAGAMSKDGAFACFEPGFGAAPELYRCDPGLGWLLIQSCPSCDPDNPTPCLTGAPLPAVTCATKCGSNLKDNTRFSADGLRGCTDVGNSPDGDPVDCSGGGPEDCVENLDTCSGLPCNVSQETCYGEGPCGLPSPQLSGMTFSPTGDAYCGTGAGGGSGATLVTCSGTTWTTASCPTACDPAAKSCH